jgi:hypothetical protein
MGDIGNKVAAGVFEAFGLGSVFDQEHDIVVFHAGGAGLNPDSFPAKTGAKFSLDHVIFAGAAHELNETNQLAVNEQSILHKTKSQSAISCTNHCVGAIQDHSGTGEQVEDLDRPLRDGAFRFDGFQLLLSLVSR